ncbi:dTDP-4-dehydrorhamnose reductase [bacterium]|jgi:dTDP-4-dehydrorhamnose reductase|nr:dTDP-4-dehydrorhamnose reductase [bacterium]MBT4121503.1 dTDP-4-dehydrorhamnose reductase [bacterium]MBT4335416.1 dTDP-4-dehydrorhamnose reductase [bacterium]MBT4495900.1 dTDP-4-dehydrorhamnose reductase [bacterium]MBT4764068.1 dTDP-4-dehydrorhamnose reductase [bacterium]
MRLLIFGAGGMLGHDLVNAFSDEDIFVADLPEWDITADYETLKNKISEVKPEVIINAAAFTDVEGAEEKKDICFKVNAEAVTSLSKICKELDILLVHISTEYVFDGLKQEGYNEEDVTKAINIYGQSKEQGEKNLIENGDKYYLVRSSWLFGKAPQQGKPRGLNFIEKMIELSKTQSSINVVNDQFGKPTFTKDLAHGIKELIKAKKEYGIYHIINEGSVSWHDLAKETFKLMGLEVDLKPISYKEYDSQIERPTNSVLNNNKLNKLRTWQEALAEYIKL